MARAVSLASTVSILAPRAPASFSSASTQHRGDALPGDARMDIEHVDMIGALQRGEADRRALDGRDQRELLGEPLAERLLVLGSLRPGCLLRLAVIVAGQLLDGGNEDRRQHRRVRGEIRPQRRLWAAPVPSRHHMPNSSGQRTAPTISTILSAM